MSASPAVSPMSASPSTPGARVQPGFASPGFGQQAQQTQSAVNQIDNKDFIDKAGLGPFAELITVSMLSVVCTLAVAAILTKFFGWIIGDADYWKSRSNEAEKIWFDLTTRHKEAMADIEGRMKIKSKLEGNP
jgi:hypothetical protein